MTKKILYEYSTCLIQSKTTYYDDDDIYYFGNRTGHNYTEIVAHGAFCSSSSGHINYDDAFDDIDSQIYSPFHDDDFDDDYSRDNDEYSYNLPTYVVTYFTDNVKCNTSNPNSYTLSVGYSCGSC